MTGIRRAMRPALAATAFAVAFGAWAGEGPVPLARSRAADGSLLEIVKTPDPLRYELRQNGHALLRLEASRSAPWTLLIAPAAEPGPSATVALAAEGRSLAWSELRYGTHQASWRSSDAPQQAQEALSGMASVAAELSASPLARPLALLREVLAASPPGGLEVLHLADTLSGGGSRVAGGSLTGFYNCLRYACEDEAGGEWSEESGGLGGCHCNPSQYGWGYCVQSAILYMIAAQRCWLDFMMPIPSP